MNETINYRNTRARLFAQSIMHIMRDFIPKDKLCNHRIYEHLYDFGIESNLQIIKVPLELEALTKLELERKMLEPFTMENKTI